MKLGPRFMELFSLKIELNRLYLADNPNTPPLARSGVVHRRDVEKDGFSMVPLVLECGHGDIEDLIAWRMAELKMAGEESEVRGDFQNGQLVNLRIHRKDGVVEDFDGFGKGARK